MTLQDILNTKGATIFTISPDATVLEVAKKLVECQVGSLLVFRPNEKGDGLRLAGIITERDVLRMVATSDTPLHELKVAEVMSTRLIVGSPTDTVEEIMGLLTRERKRHLPVLSQSQVVGIVSIGDLVKIQHRQLAVENQFMKDYITDAR